MKAFPYDEDVTVSSNKFGPITKRIQHTGMDLRDYFAAKAMYCLVSDWDDFEENIDEMAKRCYMAADAMMKAREQ